MSDERFYSRRLTGKELTLWLDLGRDALTEYEAADDLEIVELLMNLENSMFFVSFLGDTPVGASAIYKDTARNAMALLSVRIVSEYRNRITGHLIKSSLPFFKTVAIREVDCLVSPIKEEGFSFPIQNTLYDWSEQYLSEHGFVEAGVVSLRTFKIPKSSPSLVLQWDATPAKKQALRDLFWEIEEKERQDYSHFWMGIDLCRAAGRLYTISKDGRCVAAAGAIISQNQLIIMSIMHNAKEIDEIAFASSLIALAQESGVDNIVFTYLENTLGSFKEHIDSLCGNPNTVSKLKLMRKNL